MIGVLDRIEEGIAVILVEEKGDEFTVPKSKLPPKSEEGTYFKLAYKEGTYTILAIDEKETKRAQKKSATLLKKLQRKKQRSKFKRD